MLTAVEWVDDFGAFSALAAEWDALLPTDAHPFDLHCWYRCWWDTFGGDRELAVCTVRRDGRLVAAFPLLRERGVLKGFVNGHSLMTRPLAVDHAAMESLVEATQQGAKGGMELRGLPARDPGVAALEAAAGRASAMPLVAPAYASPFVDTRGDYESWREQNKHRWKAPLERKWRKMERDYEAELTLVEAPKDLDAEVAEGLRLEASGWKGEEGTAIESEPESAAFYREMARAFQERDELRFSWIVLDGIAVSFDFCLLHRNRLYTLKSGYDEDYRGLAPGLVHRLAIIKRCFELGIDEHDLLGDEVGWKTRFSAGNRPHVNLRTYPRSPAGLVRYGYKAKLRPRLKQVRDRVRARRS